MTKVLIIEHARMWVKYNMRGPVLAVDDCWRRMVCYLIDHEWKKTAWINLRCERCGRDFKGCHVEPSSQGVIQA